MARIDVTRPLLSFDGAPLVEANGNAITLRPLLQNALMATQPSETISGSEKLRRFELARRVSRLDRPMLSAEEIALCKACIDRGYGTLITAVAFEALDPSLPDDAPPSDDEP